MDFKEISDNLSAAKQYLRRLQKLREEVENAEQQIISTAEETERKIEVTFSNLLNYIVEVLNKRKNELLQESNKIKSQSIIPLKECHEVICHTVRKTENYISVGEKLSETTEIETLESFNANASSLGNLPEVPNIKEVPSITFQYDQLSEDNILKFCSGIGIVSRIAPIQITLVTENPGALLVEWQSVVSDDHLNDVQEYCLQWASGNVFQNKLVASNFKDCYVGNDMQYLVKDVTQYQEYSFRVCCKYEGSSIWSPWSLPHVASTSIKHFSWQASDHFALTNENKIARCTSDEASVIFSNGLQYKNGYCIEFMFLECDERTLENTFIGLSLHNDTSKLANSTDTFYVDGSGAININGIKKTTVLPKVAKGSRISFICNMLSEDKIRVHVDSTDKRVTYDWSTSSSNGNGLYFFFKVGSSKWKIMVE